MIKSFNVLCSHIKSAATRVLFSQPSIKTHWMCFSIDEIRGKDVWHFLIVPVPSSAVFKVAPEAIYALRPWGIITVWLVLAVCLLQEGGCCAQNLYLIIYPEKEHGKVKTGFKSCISVQIHAQPITTVWKVSGYHLPSGLLTTITLFHKASTLKTLFSKNPNGARFRRPIRGSDI